MTRPLAVLIVRDPPSLMPAASANAQSLGTFRWQLQPFCNVVTVNVTQQGAVYTADGYDDQCGAAQRAPLVGLATPNPDGTIGFGLHVVTVPGGLGVHIDARITLPVAERLMDRQRRQQRDVCLRGRHRRKPAAGAGDRRWGRDDDSAELWPAAGRRLRGPRHLGRRQHPGVRERHANDVASQQGGVPGR